MSPAVVPLLIIAAFTFLRPDDAPERVILLPEADGKVGKLIVRSAVGEQLLDAAYAASDIDAAGNLVARTEDAASVQAHYGAVLAAQPQRPVSFVVYFSPGSAQSLTPESEQEIKRFNAALHTRPAPEVFVIGHTDTSGNAAANDELSLHRAAAVKQLLEASGVEARIDVAGRGQRDLLVPTADGVAEAANRRVEINLR